MTAHIPEIDSCYAADLTHLDYFHSPLLLLLPSVSPSPAKEKKTSEEGRWWEGRARRCSVNTNELTCTNRSAVQPLFVAHYCTAIARKKIIIMIIKRCGLPPCISSSSLACLSCDCHLPPSLPPLTPPAHWLRPLPPMPINGCSSNTQGAVIYGARSLSVHAGNSNTHSLTHTREDRGDGGENDGLRWNSFFLSQS